jgi:peroxiredoxin
MRKLMLLPLAVALVTFLVTVRGLSAEPAAPAPPEPGAKVRNFTAKDVDGKPQSLNDYRSKKAIVIVIVGTECPISNLYVVTLAEMHRVYSGKGVQFLAVNSNDHDTFEEVAAHAKERKLPFPVLKDEDHSVVDALGARRTPEAFLLDGDLVIRYVGRIDDQYGYRYRRASPSQTELKNAIDEVLAGKPVTVTTSKVEGCNVDRSKKETKGSGR